MTAGNQLPAIVIMAATLFFVAYFSRNILRTVDVLYKPKIDPWIHDRQQSLRKLASTCTVKGSTPCKIKAFEAGFKTDPKDKDIEEEEKILAFLEQELEMIKEIRKQKLQNSLEKRDSIRYNEKKKGELEREKSEGTCTPLQILLQRRDEL